MKSSIVLIILATLCFLTLTPQISLSAVYTSGEINPTEAERLILPIIHRDLFLLV